MQKIHQKKKKQIFESSNSIYDSADEIVAPKDIETIIEAKEKNFKN